MKGEQVKPDRCSLYRNRFTGELGRVVQYCPHNGPIVRVDTGESEWRGNYVDFWEEWIHSSAKEKVYETTKGTHFNSG